MFVVLHLLADKFGIARHDSRSIRPSALTLFQTSLEVESRLLDQITFICTINVNDRFAR